MSLFLLKMAKGRSFLLFLFMNVLAVTAYAQVKISGQVTDNQQSPIPGITVVVRNTKLGAQTDVDGRYTINGSLPPGNYTLAYTGIGFAPGERVLVISAGTASYTLNIQQAA